MFKSFKPIISTGLIVIIAVAFAAGFFVGQSHEKTGGDGLAVVDEAWQHVLQDYVDPTKINTENATASAIRGIVASLNDRYTAFISKEDLAYVQSNFQGEFEGIGAVVSAIGDNITIVSLIAGAPAESAGLKANDVILAIDGESVVGMNVDVATSKIRGPSGTAVKLLVQHPGDATPVEISITHAKVELASVSFEMQGDIAVISILQFTSRTGDELTRIMPKLAENNAKGIVLDLRGNPGGLLDTVVQVASHFITGGTIVSVRSRVGKIETMSAVKVTGTTDLPMVVLVDQSSASGSEVLTGALQDHQRAVVAGTVTYGKGSVNVLFPLSDGSGIYITTDRWLTPDGTLIEGNGIQPDIPLTITGAEELQWAVDHLHGLN